MGEVFGAMSAAFLVARFLMLIALHVVRSDYNLVEHAVSDYAIGRTRWLSTTMTWVTAAAWSMLATGVALGLPEWSDRVVVAALLAVLTAVFIILPVVPTSLEGRPVTRIGLLHYLLAIVWFAISYALMGDFVRLAETTGATALVATLDAFSWIALGSLIILSGTLLVRSLRRRIFGIAERTFLVAVNLFYIGAALLVVHVAA